MMIKLCDFNAFDTNGEPTVVNIGRYDDTIKTAALSSFAYAPEINSFISSLKPSPGKLYTLINAMGATEYFSCNRNGDAFYEDALKKYHNTFVTDAHAFMHHKNKDPEKSYGRVIFSAYNDNMHRVELIVEYDLDKLDPKFAERIDRGEMVNVSMGCRVDADYCSICGNKAKSPAFYCEHLRDKPGLTKCLPDGRKAFAINKDPHFFDISIVTIPADPTARIMAKIASDCNVPVSSVQRAYEDTTFMDMISHGSEKTASAIIKSISINGNPTDCIETRNEVNEFPSEQEKAICECCSKICDEFDRAFGPDIPNNILDAIGRLSDNPISILKGFIKKKIFLRPRESQRITLISLHKPEMADILDKNNVVIAGDPMDASEFFEVSPCDISGADILPSFIREARSMLPDNIRRLTVKVIVGDDIEKTAGIQSVPISDNMKYLLACRGDGGVDTNLLNTLMLADSSSSDSENSMADTMKTLGILGAIVSTLGAIAPSGTILPPGALMGMYRIADVAKDQFSNIGTIKPIQEMQFLNPNSQEAIQAALMNAMLNTNIVNTDAAFSMNAPEVYRSSIADNISNAIISANMAGPMVPFSKQGSMKKVSFNILEKLPSGYKDIWNKTLPKMAITLPAAWGIGTFLSNKAEEDDMKSYSVTGKYDPSLLSRKSLTIPITAAALWKFASYRKKARDFIKKGEKIGLDKKSLLADVSKIVYDKNDIMNYHKIASHKTSYYPF